jgi:hypothetical protein
MSPRAPLLLLLAACARDAAPGEVALLYALDGARADRSSLCGVQRPTTRTLEWLRDEQGASTSCWAFAPSPKAPVALASMLTGLLPWEHRLDHRFVDPSWSDQQTLAERFAARGWRTVLVTAHPDLTGSPGLSDGYETVIAAETWSDLRGDDLVAAVTAELGRERRSLFLTVVSVDARDPWPMPDGSLLSLDVEDPASDAAIYARGGGSPAWREQLIDQARARYDLGLREADRGLRGVLDALAEARGGPRGVRLLVSGLRGNLLGEHGHLGDAGWLWDPAVRVPMVLLDTTRARPFPPLPETPLSTASAATWLLEGALPRPAIPVAAFTAHERGRAAPGDDQVAVWGPGRARLLSWRGERIRYLPGEEDDQPHLPHESGLLPALDEQLTAWQRHLAWRDRELAARKLTPAPPVWEELP